MKKLYIIAGEPSGDNLGADIIAELQNHKDKFEIFGVGGELMKNAGFPKSLFDIKAISVGGIIELIPHIFKIKKLINQTVDDIVAKQPDIVFTIDSPGFCFRVAKKIRKKNINTKLIHLVAPSVWAWRKNRAQSIAKIYDKLLTLFDFEPQYFEKYGLKTEFVGHSAAQIFRNLDVSKSENILIMPGSRRMEIKKLLPIFLKIVKKYDLQFVIPTIKNMEPLIRSIIGNNEKISIFTDEHEKLKLYQTAKFAIVASGTATLQLGLSGCPMIVCYKMQGLTYNIIKRLVKVKYISLVNIILNKNVVPELIQQDCTVENIISEIENLNTESQQKAFQNLREKLISNNEFPAKKIVSILLNF